jgi:hypothetical protein
MESDSLLSKTEQLKISQSHIKRYLKFLTIMFHERILDPVRGPVTGLASPAGPFQGSIAPKGPDSYTFKYVVYEEPRLYEFLLALNEFISIIADQGYTVTRIKHDSFMDQQVANIIVTKIGYTETILETFDYWRRGYRPIEPV